jgi:sRNA-binding regulator protein Hfq
MMSSRTTLNGKGGITVGYGGGTAPAPHPNAKKHWAAPQPVRLTAHAAADDGALRQAELFYLQKQIQAQTPMVIVLEDGEKVEGCIEWYDRQSLKVRRRAKTLVYKSAIKYMYKLGEAD